MKGNPALRMPGFCLSLRVRLVQLGMVAAVAEVDVAVAELDDAVAELDDAVAELDDKA